MKHAIYKMHGNTKVKKKQGQQHIPINCSLKDAKFPNVQYWE